MGYNTDFRKNGCMSKRVFNKNSLDIREYGCMILEAGVADRRA